MVQDALLPLLNHAQHLMVVLHSAQQFIQTQIKNVQKHQTFVNKNYVLILLPKQVLLLAQAT